VHASFKRWVLLGFTGLLGFAGFDWVLLGFDEFFTGFCSSLSEPVVGAGGGCRWWWCSGGCGEVVVGTVICLGKWGRWNNFRRFAVRLPRVRAWENTKKQPTLYVPVCVRFDIRERLTFRRLTSTPPPTFTYQIFLNYNSLLAFVKVLTRDFRCFRRENSK